MESANKTLLLGLGNELLSDDGIGVLLVNDLKYRFDPNELHCKSQPSGGLEILEALHSYGIAIIIDGIKSDNGVPSTIYHFRPHNFRETLHLNTFHNVSFRSTSKLSRQLGIFLPKQIHIIAIEVYETTEFNRSLSKYVLPFYGKIKHEVYEIIGKVLELKAHSKHRVKHGNWL
jgi:hydrogenase maturation protease